MQLMLDLKKSFFSTWIFFHEHSRITGLAGKGEGYFFNASPPPTSTSQTFRHLPGVYFKK